MLYKNLSECLLNLVQASYKYIATNFSLLNLYKILWYKFVHQSL
jgi:hypothetical protein